MYFHFLPLMWNSYSTSVINRSIIKFPFQYNSPATNILFPQPYVTNTLHMDSAGIKLAVKQGMNCCDPRCPVFQMCERLEKINLSNKFKISGKCCCRSLLCAIGTQLLSFWSDSVQNKALKTACPQKYKNVLFLCFLTFSNPAYLKSLILWIFKQRKIFRYGSFGITFRFRLQEYLTPRTDPRNRIFLLNLCGNLKFS